MVLDLTVIRLEDSTWKFTWTAGTPDYEIWLDGILLDTVTPEEFIFTCPGFDSNPPPLEIVEVSQIPDSEIHPPFLILQWREITLAKYYVLQFFTGVIFQIQKFIIGDLTGYIKEETPPQLDDTEVQWRITTLDEFDNAGASINFIVDIVKNPDPPAVNITFAAGAVQVGAT